MDALLEVEMETRLTSELMEEKDGKYIVKNVLPYRIRKALLGGDNFVGILTGKTRSGKSFSGLSLAKAIDPDFDETRVVFSAQEFMELIGSKTLKAGDMIMWDEAGIGVATRDWYSLLNKSVNYVLQTWGHQSIGLLFTVPDMSMIDSQTRKLVNMYFKTTKLLKGKNRARLKAYYLSPMEKAEMKKVRPRYIINGRKVDVQYIEIMKPPVKLVNRYLKKKESFTARLNEDVLFDIRQLEISKDRDAVKGVSDKELVEKAWDMFKDYIKIKKGKRTLNAYLVKKKLDITHHRAGFIVEELLEKSKREDYPSLESENNLEILQEEDDKKPAEALRPENFL